MPQIVLGGGKEERKELGGITLISPPCFKPPETPMYEGERERVRERERERAKARAILKVFHSLKLLKISNNLNFST